MRVLAVSHPLFFILFLMLTSLLHVYPDDTLFIIFIMFMIQIFSPPLPSGFTLRSLDKDAAYINTFNDNGSLADAAATINHLARDYVTYLPSAGIFQNDSSGDGKLVAYSLCDDVSGIGKLFVRPEFRRQNFASRLIVHLSHRLTGEGYPNKTYLGVYVTNKKAIACYKRLGFTEVPNSSVTWFFIDDLKAN